MLEQLPMSVAPNDLYPHAKHAVFLWEMSIAKRTWQLLVEAEQPIETVLLTLQALTDTWARKHPDSGYPKAAAEMKTDDFRRYVAAKLGMM